MSGERGRGAVLYTLAALILMVGVGWWWRAAPRQSGDERLISWRYKAEQLLPDVGDQELANTLALEGGVGHDEVVEVEQGDFLISVVCAGEDGSRVRVSLGIGDSGRGVRCSGSRTPEIISVGLFDELHMRVAVESPGPVVFRYALQRSNG
ncbi:hypothetical protein Q0Z83_092090 [Actinoplanes sichuanensis]|uniref:DUF6023 family protein n=1 Tax=Actinoplanes sichuanensis TaxID=512349 RepID=A0ABW4ALZ2_9ACTN|nr:DUF6023 family protein [Actinoplanes sichuanensis]BEL11018.1 hypothetical protein Q0Z83_092090 [Actinoplanes sichuanensis]